MDMYKLKFTKLQNEIFRLLCIKSGTSLNQRKIASLLGVSPTAISKSIKSLEKNNLIKINKEEAMNLVSVRFNREDSRAVALKRAENLEMIYESGLVEFLGKFSGASIILFGSYSYGEDTMESDIDIAIVGSKRKDIDVKVFEKLLEREIIINFYKSFKEIHKHLKENICNGIVLKGGIEL